MKFQKWIFASLLILGMAILACDKSEDEGSGSLDPGTTSAEIVEGYICGGIYEGKPTIIDNTFFPDDVVYLWLNWANVSGNHNVRVIWLDPSNDVVADYTERFNSKTGRAVTFFFLDTTNSAPDGQWVVEIEIDGEFVRSYAFWILSD